ncbi:S41 family peptidase [Treponema denticola]
MLVLFININNMMKKEKLLIKIIKFIIIISFIIAAVIVSKNNDMVFDTRLSQNNKEADYKYFWDFIYNGYPFKEVCERVGANLKMIQEENYKKLSSLITEREYYDFYKNLCTEITSGKNIGHLLVMSYDSYIREFEPNTEKLRKYRLIINSFYKRLGATQDEKDFFKLRPSYISYKIVEPEKIVYLKIDSFYTLDRQHYKQYAIDIWNFLRNTAGYKHIIIDIRDNGGGYLDNYTIIIQPNTGGKNLKIKQYVLYNDNKYTKLHIEDIFKTTYIKLISKKNIKGVKNCGTLRNDKAFVFENIIVYCPLNYYKPCKDKKFWLLVNGGSFSASDSFAYICKQSGFATVIGENTGGSGLNSPFIGPQRMVLPNSGLVIRYDYGYGLNEDGTSNAEFGTAPDIYNLPGKDALETCLEEIRKLGERTNF